ncbi:autotransporter-associated beta strand repeat-containing protein [Paraflavisolibacter sp. H34]|uniref:rhamnogalacturonan lyase family protein n=1 Tax=Huijunlia imazamoxiresistens TaxID=3127457 RepID=UPI0030168B26
MKRLLPIRKSVFKNLGAAFLGLCSLLYADAAYGQRKMEKLGRGVVATRTATGKILVSWRLLGTEPQDIGFNLYRSANGGAPVKLNSEVLYAGTNFEDLTATASAANTYFVKPVWGGAEKAAEGSFTVPANTPTAPYYRVPMRTIANYQLRYAYVGDLDGDGEYDFVVHRGPKSGTPSTVPDLVEAYKRDGTHLWTIEMGPNSYERDNIYAGSAALHCGHGDNMTVYDMDCDGKAEVIVRTANGVKFADGSMVVDANNNKQFVSVLNGMTGNEISRAPVQHPYVAAGPMNGHMGIAYLDGIHPSIVLMAANRNADLSFNEVVNTWNWKAGGLEHNWFFDLAGKKLPTGHQIKIFDIDGDGKDEIVPQAFALDDNGTLLYNLYDQAIDHGDRFAIGDLDPKRPGLELYGVQQGYSKLGIMWYYCDARTGKVLLSQSNPSNPDMGRGMTGDFDPRYNGHELYTFVEGLYNVSGVVTSTRLPGYYPNQRIWWDGDLASEILDQDKFAKWNYLTNNDSRLYTATSAATGAGVTLNGRVHPALYGDLIGDWREEAVYESNENNALVILTTPYFTDHRIYTLPHNPGYRNDMCVKGYYQSNNPDYFIGFGMQAPPLPPIQEATAYWTGLTPVWDHAATNWSNGTAARPFADGDTLMFDIRGNSADTLRLNATAAPARIWAMNPEGKDYIIGGSGKLTGTMDLWKTKPGSFTLAGAHDYTGPTLVTEGQFNVDGSVQSKVFVKGLGALGGRGTLAGGLSLDAGVSSKGGHISPGFGATGELLGTLTVSGDLQVGGNNNFTFDVLPGAPKINDSLVVTGNLSFTGTSRLVVNFSGNNFVPGTYTLIRSLGTLTAAPANFTVEGIGGVSKELLVENNSVKIRINAARPAAHTVWTGAVDTTWDFDHQNFSLEGSATAFVSGDNLTFDSTAVQRNIVLTETVYPASVTVNGDSAYTISGTGSIGGATGLVKNDSSNLTLASATHTYTGKTIINGGTLTVARLGLRNEPSSIGAADSAAANILISNANLVVNERSTTNRSMTINGTTTITIPVAANYAIFDADITGNGGLVKDGPGAVYLVGAKSFTGPVLIKSGRINLRRKEGNMGGLGTSNDITLENATLALEDVRDYAAIPYNLTVPGGKEATLVTDGRSSLLGTLKGSGTLNLDNPFIRTDYRGNWSAFTGKLQVLQNDLRIANTFGYANAAINLAGGKMYSISGASSTIAIGELSGVAGTSLGSDNSTAIWTIGAKNTDATFAGNIGKSALTKVGTGTLTLTGSNTYSGATNINAGRLLVNNSTGTRGTGAGAVTVASGATLGGTGFIKGAITVQSGAKLQPGSNGIGTLTDSTSVTFASGAIAEMEVNTSASVYDQLKVTGSIAYNGKLVLSKTDNVDFVIGDQFRLFDATSYSGAFTSIEPAVPGPGLKWDLSELGTTGTLKVAVDASGVITTYYWKGTGGTATDPASWSSGTNWNTAADGSGATRTRPAGDDILIFDGNVIGTSEQYIGHLPTQTVGSLQVINGARVAFQADTAHLYTGSTSLVAGRLLVNSTTGTKGIGAGAVTVANGAILGGTGYVKGAISVNAGGTLQPGSDGIGALTGGTSITLADGATTEMDINKSAASFDVLKVAGGIAFNGKLSLTKTGAANFAAGDQYRLFEGGTYSGGFTSFQPATPGAGLKWDTTDLRTTGTLKVAADITARTYYWRGGLGSVNTPANWNTSANWSTARTGTATGRPTPAPDDILVFDGSLQGTGDCYVGQLSTQTVGALQFVNGAKVNFASSVYPTTSISDAFTSAVYGGCTYAVTGTTGSFASLKPGDVITTASAVVNPMPYAQVLAVQDATHMTVSKEGSFPATAQAQYFLAPTLYTGTLTVDATSTIQFGTGANSFYSFVLNTRGGTVAGKVNFVSRGGHHKLVCTTPNGGSATAGLHFTGGAALSISTSTSGKGNYNLGNTLGQYLDGKFIFNDGQGANNRLPGYTGAAGIVFESGSTFTMGAGEHHTPLGTSFAATGDLTYTPATAFMPGSKYVNNSARISAPQFIGNDERVSYPNLEFQAGFPTNLNLGRVETLTVGGTSGAAVNTGSLVVTGDIVNLTANAINFGNVLLGGTANQAISGNGPVAFGNLNIADKAQVTLGRNVTATNVDLLGKLHFGSYTLAGSGVFATYAPYTKETTSAFTFGSKAVSGVTNTGAGTLQYEYPLGSSVTAGASLAARTLYRSFTGGTDGQLSTFALATAGEQAATFSIEGSSYTTGGVPLTAAAPGFSYLLEVNGREEQVITFGALGQKFMGEPDFNPGATASSGLPVSYASSNEDVAIVQGGLLRIVGVGTTTITATQPGDAANQAAPAVAQELTVVKKGQAITFAALGEKGYGDADFNAGATATSGLSVVYSSSNPEVAEIVNGQVRINGLGTTLIAAAQEGNEVYEAAATVIRSLTVTDKKAPLQPQALTTTKTADGKVGLMWQASSDDIGVTGYYVFLNGRQLNEQPLTTTSYVTNAPAGSLVYAYTVIAADAAGNLSPESASALFANSNGGGNANPSLEILKIFPNPNGGNFKVRLNSEETGTVVIGIYNSKGVLVQSTSEGKSGDVYQREFNLHRLNKGMYLVKVAVGSFMQTSIVLIQ